MTDQGPGTDCSEHHGSFAPAWTSNEELEALADAIVRNGTVIERKTVPDLRQLIEAVQSAAENSPGARLAPPREQRGDDWKPPYQFIALEIRGGEIADARCTGLDIRVVLVIESTFTGAADFDKTSFARHAIFSKAAFSGIANFEMATFSGIASFNEAMFSARANFEKAMFFPRTDFAIFSAAAFSGTANFKTATFSGKADFYSARFSEKAIFEEATFSEQVLFAEATFSRSANFVKTAFSDDAIFWMTTFSSDANFSSVTLERRLLLNHSTFAPTARMLLRDAYLRPGSHVAVPFARIRHAAVPDGLGDHNSGWLDESDLGQEDHARRLWRWFVQYGMAVLSPFIRIPDHLQARSAHVRLRFG